MSQGIQTTATNLCLILETKINLLNPPTFKTSEKLKGMMTIAEEATSFSLELELDEDSLEKFQGKIVWLLESVLKLMILWDQELILSLKQNLEGLRLPLMEIKKTQFVKEIVSLYKVIYQFYMQYTFFTSNYNEIVYVTGICGQVSRIFRKIM
jgi:hypothetical protein